ncbi:hypothetical protein F5X99DRAFT_407727 [Biscogniauxia marginata]|nr:hypothetical protein F5X99DRAFT_407727 [Biscogniauxia marginata]
MKATNAILLAIVGLTQAFPRGHVLRQSPESPSEIEHAQGALDYNYDYYAENYKHDYYVDDQHANEQHVNEQPNDQHLDNQQPNYQHLDNQHTNDQH